MVTPNHLTLLRFLLGAGLPILLLWQRTIATEVIAIIGFTIACVTDWWDGHLARTKSMMTHMGKITDPIADKLLILGLMVVFWHFHLYSFYWIVLIIIREISVTVARLICLARQHVIPAEWSGKLKVGFQIGSIGATFMYLLLLDSHLFSPGSAPLIFIIALNYLGLLLANFFTVISGSLFFYRLFKS